MTRNPHALVVASCGRSGSTMLTNAIARSSVRCNLGFVEKGVAQSLERPAFVDLNGVTFKRGYVYKTHSYPPTKKVSNYVKFIYIYSDPYKIVASLYRKNRLTGGDWIKKHSSNFGESIDSVEEAIKKDSLGIRKNYIKWSGSKNIKLAMVKMNKLWESIEKISRFVGFSIKLPPKKERRSSIKKLPQKIKNIMSREYKNLRNDMKNKKPVSIQ